MIAWIDSLKGRHWARGLIGSILILLCLFGNVVTAQDNLPPGFVYLSTVAPSIRQDMRYYGAMNFLGRPISGYKAPICILSKPAAEALANVQANAMLAGYSLKVYDCYRPQMAVDDFVAWAKQLDNQFMKRWFYPRVRKQNLFRDGYIAEKSGHSRGSTVDLTLVKLNSVQLSQVPNSKSAVSDCRRFANFRFRDDSIDMGTGFDCFDPLSHTDNWRVSESAKVNRLYLKQLMEQQGFRNLPEEWWHYTLTNEPFPNDYFNFPILLQSEQLQP